MATRQERLHEAVIEHQTEALAQLDDFAQQRTVRRNREFAQCVRSIRLHVVEANAAACRLWFFRDTLTDLPPERAA